MKVYKILWIILVGIPCFIECAVLGLVSALTIIGIPIAKVWFTYATLFLNPFEKEIDISFSEHKFLNTLWLLTFGWMFVVSHYLGAVVMWVTLIFFPYGKQYAKIGKFSIAPIGADIS